MAASEKPNDLVLAACRRFLNTTSSREFDPGFWLDIFSESELLDSSEIDWINAQPSLPHRQYAFLLEILPFKNLDAILRVTDIFLGSQQAAARDLRNAIHKECGGTDFELADEVHEEFQQLRVNQLTVESGGSTGDRVITPDGYQPSELPQHDGHLVKLDEVRVDKIVGNGSFAVVHLGSYAGRQVAIKKFTNYDTFALTMFMAEVNIMKNLNHPNVVKFVGYIRDDSQRQLWLLTEFISGGSMRRLCDGDPSLSMGEKLRVAVECWHGLAYLHGRKCCHKDISSNNILISTDLSQVKISDFGLSEFKSLLTTTVTTVKGTAMYQPPEFACANGPLRHPTKSDVYSMGASLCELFSEQYFWNLDGRPRLPMQVCCKLLQQRESVDAGLTPCDPDCWPDVADLVKPMLRSAINADYRQRLNASELGRMTEELSKSY